MKLNKFRLIRIAFPYKRKEFFIFYFSRNSLEENYFNQIL
jgi:hypothetical protein